MHTEQRVKPEEMRVFRRVALAVDVDIHVTQGGYAGGRADNLSEGGIFVLTRDVLPMMSRVVATFPLPTSPERLSLEGVVRWLRPSGRFPAGIGIEFVAPSEDMLSRINDYVETQEPMVWEEGPAGGMVLPREVAVEYVPIIRRIAHGQARALSMSVDDLIGAGFLGLVEAYRSYRAREGVPFESYARLRIRGSIKDEARGADPLTRGQRDLARHLRMTRDAMAQNSHEEPSNEALASAAGVSPTAVAEHRAVVNAATQQVSMDDQLDHTQDGSASPEEPLLRRERQAVLDEALSALPTRMQDILRMYYGDAMTLRAIASVLGVSEARVSQLHTDAVQRLRAACSDPD